MRQKNTFTNILEYPLHLLFLPLFFVLHGYTELYDLIPMVDSLKLAGAYILTAIVLYGLCLLLFRNFFKASLFVFLLMALNFFFGLVQDFLKRHFATSFISSYSFILPVGLVLFITLVVLLKKARRSFSNITRYLNFLFIILILFDSAKLISKKRNKHEAGFYSKDFLPCENCKKPDIYYLVADEYAGKKELTDLFHFDNSEFENALRQRGFHIVEDSKSNYNYTMFSAPSILNMGYIPGIEKKNSSAHDRKLCNDVVRTNRAYHFFTSIGYKFYNYSIFDIEGHPTPAKSSFLPVSTRPLIAQTFIYRVYNDLWFHLATNLKLRSAKEGLIYKDKINNEYFIDQTKKIVKEKIASPKFVYTHLLMPHYPYYYDKNGKENSYEKLNDKYDSDTSLYISYLQYCNKKFIGLIDFIKQNSKDPPIIIFMSDHGFKSFKNEANPEYHFYNLNSIFLPDSNYVPFYSGMSNVNQFRLLLNTEFKQKLPLLRDSTIVITEQ